MAAAKPEVHISQLVDMTARRFQRLDIVYVFEDTQGNEIVSGKWKYKN